MSSKLRRSMLFSPANNPKMLFTAPIYGPDCIIFDLEDSVKYAEKDEARDLLCEALRSLDFGGCEVFARINPLYTEFGEEDVRALVAAGLTRVRLPMCGNAEDIRKLAALLDEVEAVNGLAPGTVKIQGAIETPQGVLNAYAIATASDRMISISFGAEDFTRSLGVDRSADGRELLLARSSIVLAASAAGIDAIDTAYTDVRNMAGFKEEARLIKQLGFAGKACIHPAQIDAVHEVFTPSQEEIDFALQVLEVAGEEDLSRGGVALLNGRMIDVPVIAKANRIASLAQALTDKDQGKENHHENSN